MTIQTLKVLVTLTFDKATPLTDWEKEAIHANINQAIELADDDGRISPDTDEEEADITWSCIAFWTKIEE